MAKIKLDFTDVNKPTSKQLNFAKAISSILEIPMPELTRQSVSAFITEYQEEFKYRGYLDTLDYDYIVEYFDT